MRKNPTVAILYGGDSQEREVSLRSGKNVQTALENKGYKTVMVDPAAESLETMKCDLVFNALHGGEGEDGTIQKQLDQLNIPYTGSGEKASKLGMNKLEFKAMLSQNGLPTPQYQLINQELVLQFPIIVKPIVDGSSIGIEIIDTLEEYNDWKSNIQNEQDWFCESYIPGKEITAGLIITKTGQITLPILELRPQNRFYDFDAKYTKGKTEFICPATISHKDENTAQEYSDTCATLIGAKGAIRLDMIVHETKGPTILEINTSPGLTKLSDIPAQAKVAGMDYESLIETILWSAVEND